MARTEIAARRDDLQQFLLPLGGAGEALLQGKDLTLQNRFAQRSFWPNANSLPSEEDLDWDYGSAGTYNRAQYFCTRFLEDIGQLIHSAICSHFELVRYAEKLCVSLADFSPLAAELEQQPNYIDLLMLRLLDETMAQHRPDMVGLSVPFPGNLLAALRVHNISSRRTRECT